MWLPCDWIEVAEIMEDQLSLRGLLFSCSWLRLVVMLCCSLIDCLNLSGVFLLAHAARTERGTCHFLHLLQGIGKGGIFHFCSDELLADVLLMVVPSSQLANILFYFLSKCFWYLSSWLLLLIQFKFLHLAERRLVDVFMEEPSFSQAISENHDAEATLDSIIPITSVETSVSPVHFTISFLLIFDIFSFELAAGAPSELSVTMLHISLVHSCVFV